MDPPRAELTGRVRSLALRTVKEYGFQIDSREVHSQLAKQKSEVSNTWDAIRMRVWQRDLNEHYEIRIGRERDELFPKFLNAFSFGYRIGSDIAKIFDGSSDEADQAGILSGLFNLCIAIFDTICDNDLSAFERLNQIVNGRTLREGARPRGTSGDHVFEASLVDPILIRILCPLIREYFIRFDLLQEQDGSLDVRRQFLDSILRLYDAEIESKTCRFDSHLDSHRIYEILRTKSSLPMQVIFLNAITSMSSRPKFDMQVLNRVAVDMGDAIWIVDDLADAISDLYNLRWSYVWLRFATQFEHKVFDDGLVGVSKQNLSETLLRTNVIGEAASVMCNRLADSVSCLASNCTRTDDLRYDLLLWVNSWLL